MVQKSVPKSLSLKPSFPTHFVLEGRVDLVARLVAVTAVTRFVFAFSVFPAVFPATFASSPFSSPARGPLGSSLGFCFVEFGRDVGEVVGESVFNGDVVEVFVVHVLDALAASPEGVVLEFSVHSWDFEVAVLRCGHGWAPWFLYPVVI